MAALPVSLCGSRRTRPLSASFDDREFHLSSFTPRIEGLGGRDQSPGGWQQRSWASNCRRPPRTAGEWQPQGQLLEHRGPGRAEPDASFGPRFRRCHYAPDEHTDPHASTEAKTQRNGPTNRSALFMAAAMVQPARSGIETPIRHLPALSGRSVALSWTPRNHRSETAGPARPSRPSPPPDPDWSASTPRIQVGPDPAVLRPANWGNRRSVYPQAPCGLRTRRRQSRLASVRERLPAKGSLLRVEYHTSPL